MNIDASAFVKRARFFLAELKKNTFPNTSSIQRFDGCSRATASRLIERLQSEFFFPICYDSSQRGYLLTNPDFTYEFLPPGKDEFAALFLLRELSDTIGASDVRQAITSLWNSAIGGKSSCAHDLDALCQRFSADLTAVSTIADTGVLSLLEFAATGTPVQLSYKSPWRHAEPKEYIGFIDHIHLSDGNIYLLFLSADGRTLVLNAACIKSVRKLGNAPAMPTPLLKKVDHSWLDGFGIWASEKIVNAVITIAPPAAEHYATQRWHEDQDDRWEDGKLVRTLPSMISPELVRRIISLGRYLIAVEPAELRELVKEEIAALDKVFACSTS
jgi:predicted DNA-binding transcriptional regulator YafY